jgi:hypothetical protein
MGGNWQHHASSLDIRRRFTTGISSPSASTLRPEPAEEAFRSAPPTKTRQDATAQSRRSQSGTPFSEQPKAASAVAGR